MRRMGIRSSDQLTEAHPVVHVNDGTDGMWCVATVGGCVWWYGIMAFYHFSSNHGGFFL